MVEFSTKFIAFVDIIGFKGLVAQAEAGDELSLDRILAFTEMLGSTSDKLVFEKYGPTVLPDAEKIRPDVDFQLTQISDCVVVSTEVSDGGVINLLSYCSTVILRLLNFGLMCRGYITKGSIYHSPMQVIGTGYQKAYDTEAKTTVFKCDDDQGGPPYIEIDSSVSNYVEQSKGKDLKEMFHQLTLNDDKGLIALYPFKRYLVFLDWAICGNELSDNERKARVETVRQILKNVKRGLDKFVPKHDEKALEKLNHYRRALDAQLTQCDEADQTIDDLSKPAVRFF